MTLFQDKTQRTGILIALIAAIIYGLYPAASRGVYLDGGNITFVVLVTTFFRLITLYSFAIYRGEIPFSQATNRKPTIIAGICQALSIIGILGGAFFMPGAIVMIIVFTSSLMLLLYSAYRGDLQLNTINLSTTLLALCGLGLVLDIGLDGFAYPLAGIALAFLGAVSAFYRMYIYGQEMKTRHPATVGAEAFTIALLLLTILCFWEMPVAPATSKGWIMTGLASASLAAGTVALMYGIAILGAYRLSMTMNLEPIFTTIFGILIVNDLLNPGQYLGILIVIASLIILQLYDRGKAGQ